MNPSGYSIKTRYLFQKETTTHWAVVSFCMFAGEIRMCLERPGGAFIDQFKNWSILLFAPSPAGRKCKRFSPSPPQKVGNFDRNCLPFHFARIPLISGFFSYPAIKDQPLRSRFRSGIFAFSGVPGTPLPDKSFSQRQNRSF